MRDLVMKANKFGFMGKILPCELEKHEASL